MLLKQNVPARTLGLNKIRQYDQNEVVIYLSFKNLSKKILEVPDKILDCLEL